MDILKVKNLGPIKQADIRFGDLTLFVGPQASGKSILLQLIKLIKDKEHIRRTLEQYSYVWGDNTNSILDLYFGEGMNAIWQENTEIQEDGVLIGKDFLLDINNLHTKEKLYELEHVHYVPAQRVLSVADGRPKLFAEFDETVPYTLKYFSNLLREIVNHPSWNRETLLPREKIARKPATDMFGSSIYAGGTIQFKERRGQRKFSLQYNDANLPFMTWSSGQKEFLPLLLSLYWLLDARNKDGKDRRDNIEYVIIEEPEMGLHPKAIKDLVLQVISLIARDYKVIVSTHSTVFLEFAWALRILQEEKAGPQALFDLFEIKKANVPADFFKKTLSKNVITYFFDRKDNGVVVRDISSLDAGSEDAAISEWGGLSSFASKACEIVGKNVAL